MLYHPHTSAGRVPTDVAYRFYVDSLMQLPSSPIKEQQQLTAEIFAAGNAIEGILRRAAQSLGVITQELELIMAALEVQTPTKEDIHTLISQAPSLRYLSEMGEGQIRGMENQWHKIYLGLQSLLGQLKVQQGKVEEKTGWSLFGRK